MLTNVFEIRTDLDNKKIQNLKFAEFLKGICEATPFYIAKSIHALAKAYADAIDCTACGNCCHDIMIHINAEDRRRLANRLGITEPEFRATYCQKTDTGWAFTDLQCPFLENRRCLVYADHHRVCRQFPSQDLETMCLNGSMSPTLMEIVRLAYRCPIYYNVLEELKVLSGYSETFNNAVPAPATGYTDEDRPANTGARVGDTGNATIVLAHEPVVQE